MAKINNLQKKLTLARLNSLSDKIVIHLGHNQAFTKDQLIEQVSTETDVGQQIVDIQINFLRDLAQGKIYSDD